MGSDEKEKAPELGGRALCAEKFVPKSALSLRVALLQDEVGTKDLLLSYEK